MGRIPIRLAACYHAGSHAREPPSCWSDANSSGNSAMSEASRVSPSYSAPLLPRDVVADGPQPVRDCLEAVLCGEEMDFNRGLLLAEAEGAALDALIAVADHLRRE